MSAAGNPLRVYIAGRYSRRAELAAVAAELAARRVIVTSRWLDGRHDAVPPRQCAQEDVEDIDRAQGLLFFAETETAGYMTGGRHWEAGYAYARGLWIWIIGAPENVFHELAGRVSCFATIAQWTDRVLATTAIEKRPPPPSIGSPLARAVNAAMDRAGAPRPRKP